MSAADALPRKGRLITFEGIDGAGKSSHVDWLVGHLRDAGMAVVRSREPGGEPLAEDLRTLLLTRPMTPISETLLAFAARRQHLEAVIEPALRAGRWVVCDRFTDSTYAYQGGGHGVDWQRIADLEAWVQGDLRPDLTLLFEVAPDTAEQRRSGAREPDLFETQPQTFFQRVRAAYLRRVAEQPQRFEVVAADQSIEQVRAQLEAIVAARIAAWLDEPR